MAGTRRSEHQAPIVVGVVGRSGSGKTSLLEQLVPALAARGLDVGIVKHTSHGFLADRPGKDSHRLYEAGAEAVALISVEQLATFTRLRAEPDAEPCLATALATLPDDLDLVLAEGFSWEPIPRLVVVPSGEAPLPKHFQHGRVLRIVRIPNPATHEKPEIPRRLIDQLALELADLTPSGGGPGNASPLRHQHPPGFAPRSLGSRLGNVSGGAAEAHGHTARTPAHRRHPQRLDG